MKNELIKMGFVQSDQLPECMKYELDNATITVFIESKNVWVNEIPIFINATPPQIENLLKAMQL